MAKVIYVSRATVISASISIITLFLTVYKLSFRHILDETTILSLILVISATATTILVIIKVINENLIYRLTVLHSHNAVITITAKGQINSINLIAEDIFGLRTEELTGKNFKEVFTGKSGDNEIPLTLPIDDILKSGKSICGEEKVFTDSDGWITNLVVDIFPLLYGIKTIGAVAIARDMTHRKIMEERLRSAVVRDSLTNLYNHKYIKERLEMELAVAGKNGANLTLLLIDIDNFKHCNDNYGHLYGDQVLYTFANILKSNVRNSDIVGRYGGDEFAIILPDTDIQISREIAERIRESVQGFEFLQKELLPGGRLTVSIGIAGYPDNTSNPYELIKMADEALYEAKRTAKNKVEVYFSALKEFQNELCDAERSVIETTKTLLAVINAKDKYTYSHSEQVAFHVGIIARSLGIPDQDVKKLKLAAFLHDVGKIEINPEILNKSTPLTHDEWQIIKQHPEWGAEILRPLGQTMQDILPAVLGHHERFDGNGYPNGLAGEKIPLGARIITLADAYDAMRTNRPYKKGMTITESIEEIKKCRGIQFDPFLVDIFTGEIIKQNYCVGRYCAG